jgi:hypothetical protein
MLPVAAGGQHAGPLQSDQSRLETGNSLIQVGDPARLAHLTVVDDVDPDLHRPGHHVRDGPLQAALVGVLVIVVAAIARGEEAEQIIGPDEAPGMRGEDPVHVTPLLGSDSVSAAPTIVRAACVRGR